MLGGTLPTAVVMRIVVVKLTMLTVETAIDITVVVDIVVVETPGLDLVLEAMTVGAVETLVPFLEIVVTPEGVVETGLPVTSAIERVIPVDTAHKCVATSARVGATRPETAHQEGGNGDLLNQAGEKAHIR